MDESRSRADFSFRGDAAVMRGVMHRTREGGLIVRETPERPSFWFGHGYELAAPPSALRLGELARVGRKRFAAIPGAQRFVILNEHAVDAHEIVSKLPPSATAERNRVMRFESAVSVRACWEVTAVAGVADFATIRDLLSADGSPDMAEFQRWAAGVWERAAGAGFARFVAVRDKGAIVGYAGLFDSPDESLARFCTPVTHPAYRRRGIFTACAHALLNGAIERGIRNVQICAEAQSANESLYRSLGFAVVAEVDAYIVAL